MGRGPGRSRRRARARPRRLRRLHEDRGQGVPGPLGGRFINTHPALLPSFPGAHGVRDALAYGAKVTGCTVHFVDDGVDTGPIIAQGVVDIRDEDDESALHERIKEVERRLLVEVVGRLARNGYRIEGRKVVIQ